MSGPFKTIPSWVDSMDRGKTWTSPIKSEYYRRQDPDRFKYFDEEVVSIDDLIKSNNLDDPAIFESRSEIWGSNPNTLKYDVAKDKSPTDIINGTRKLNGEVKLNDGRHRIRALKNAGFTHVRIPITNEIFSVDDALREDYYTNKDPKVLKGIAKTLPYFSTYGPETTKMLQRLFEKKARFLKK